MNGIFAVNKPKGITSHDVVARVRKLTGVKRVGHGGTLDPLASGVLVIAVRRENTKLLDQYVKGEKEYEAVVKLGMTSATADEEGEKKEISNKVPEVAEIRAVLKMFTGTILQTPPLYSAIKVSGKAAYKYARSGKTLELKPRPVEIKEIEILEYTYPMVKLRVVTGSGVYIRSLAQDIGEKLKTGAYLADLVRTRVNTFTIDAAYSFSLLENILKKQ